MFLKYIIDKISTIPDYIRNNRLGYGLRLFLRTFIKLPIIVKTKNGAFIFLGFDPIDDIILRDLNTRLQDVYFPRELSLNENDIVFDLGGHHGIFAAELAARYPGVQICSFEPGKSAVSYFKFNRILNFRSRIRLIEGGLDVSSKTNYFIKSEEGSWGDYVQDESSKGAYLVKMVGVDEILEQYSIKNIKYAKFNAEGAEFRVIPELFRLKVFPEYILLFAHPEKGDLIQLLQLLSNGYLLLRKNECEKRPWYLFKAST